MKELSMTSYLYIFIYACWLRNPLEKNSTSKNRCCGRANPVDGQASHSDEGYLFFLTFSNNLLVFIGL
jgi:hypothetical protein